MTGRPLPPDPQPLGPTARGPSRRHALQHLAWPAGPGCTPPAVAPPRIGTHPWRGYEWLHLARQRRYIADDAVVGFEPVCSALLDQGARRLFSSAEAPGLIVDVLAVRAEAVDSHGPALRSLVAGLFQARADWLGDPASTAPLLAPRLGRSPADVVRAFDGVQLPDLAANHDGLGGAAPALVHTARRVVTVMQRAGLLPADADPLTSAAGDVLVDPRFLPAAR